MKMKWIKVKDGLHTSYDVQAVIDKVRELKIEKEFYKKPFLVKEAWKELNLDGHVVAIGVIKTEQILLIREFEGGRFFIDFTPRHKPPFWTHELGYVELKKAKKEAEYFYEVGYVELKKAKKEAEYFYEVWRKKPAIEYVFTVRSPITGEAQVQVCNASPYAPMTNFCMSIGQSVAFNLKELASVSELHNFKCDFPVCISVRFEFDGAVYAEGFDLIDYDTEKMKFIVERGEQTGTMISSFRKDVCDVTWSF